MFSRRSFLVALLSVAVGLYLLPSPIDPKPHVLKGPPPALEGPLAVNTRLQKGRRLFSGELHGPESFTADDGGNVYTGTVDGKLWRIGPDDSLTLITQMGQNLPECGSSPDYEPLCGRPHGVRLDRRGQLIVADSYLGLHSVDPQTGDKTLLLPNPQGADGVPFAFLNGLEISPQTGIIYFTDSSSRWGRRHVKLEVIELNSLGRLLAFDPQTGSVRVLLDSLYMPNGVVLSPDEHFLLLAETSIGRILRFWLKGPRAGTTEIVMDNMVGYPDNIRLSDHGTFLVGITTPRFRKLVPPFLDAIAPYPAVKRFLAKVIPLSWYSLLLPRYALVLELGLDGELVGSLHDPEGRLTWAISDVFQHRGRTYLGSTDLPFLPVLEGWDS
ncbi:adipocyte plasma membrane-associated protein [Hippoglossus hippoglossus]|uniref:adipocyte plasma membrane-associated protein n=1 Tax=Hippoglossus hippoglossus TaxID=8267 RepID=UPI00148B8948|nr:adipocyte plasma membrane-associated protein [Hippoglossus hippoglossus]XP_034434662.1 adipocyte plasma membrane-associated protein [Hippoglossus hippoglossus]